MASRRRRPARRAASLSTLARSAPVKPGVCAAMWSRSTSGSRRLPRTCTSRIALRPARSGRSTTTWRSKRPRRSSAGSSTSGRLVAAISTTPEKRSKPSISTRSWFSVVSRSSWPPTAAPPRARPAASISSMNTMAGALSRTLRNRSRTRAAPTPTHISTNSVPEMEKNGTSASPATARASSVLPVPGGPTSRMPRGGSAPMAWNCSGWRRKSRTSRTSATASSAPAMSAKVTLPSASPRRAALFRAPLLDR